MRLSVVLLFAMLIPLANCMGPAKGPLAQIENPTRDVGTVLQGEPIKQVFVITNKGSSTLEILDVAHS